MLTRPVIGTRHRSTLTGDYVTVKDVKDDRVLVLNNEGNTDYIHIRDFNAEFREAPRRLP